MARFMGLLLFGSLILFLLTGLVLLTWWGWAGDDAIIAAAFAMAPVIILATLLFASRIHRNQGIAVLFCRRFGSNARTVERNLWIQETLVGASRDIAVPVTLQDEGIELAPELSLGLKAAAILVGLAICVAMLIGILLPLLLTIDSSWPIPFIFFGTAGATVYVGLKLAKLYLWLRRQVGSRSANQAGKLLPKLLRGQKSRTDVLILRSNADRWQEHVQTVLDHAGAAAIDVTDATEHLAWESDCVLKRLGSEQVLFLRASLGPRDIECTLGQVPSINTDVTVLRFSARDMHHWRRTVLAGKAIRNWLRHRGTVSVERGRQYLTYLDSESRRGLTRGSVAYAMVAPVYVSFGVFLWQKELNIGMTLILSIAIALSTYFFARKLLLPEPLRTSHTRAMARGAKIFVSGFAAVYIPIAVVASVIASVPVFSAGVFLLLLTAFAGIAASCAITVVGAMSGLLIERSLLVVPELHD